MVHPVAVFGGDDRIPLPPKLQPLRERIGVLFNLRQRTVCTAFCLAPSIVGTAAHCLFKTVADPKPRLADFWFARNYDVQRDYARIEGYDHGAAAQHVMSGSFGLSTVPPIDATHDWAFIRLSRPICSKGVLSIQAMPQEAVIAESKAGHVYQIAYHKDFAQWKPAYSKPCAVGRNYPGARWAAIAADFAEPQNLLLHTCDTGGASSGSPLLLDTPTGPKVIGINVGTYMQSRALVHDGVVADTPGTTAVANTGVAATAFAQAFSAFKSARILSTMGKIRELQDRLRQLGYYTGGTDGTYGPAVKQAIEAYETAKSLPPTGLASDEMLIKPGTPHP